MPKAGKGSSYERQLCKQLSLWWSKGTNDDWFWRSSQSGGRATTRRKSGKSTVNAAGDICAMCPEGQRFLNVVTIEAKRGYTSATLSDLVEKKSGSLYHGFIEQARTSALEAATTYWLLIHKRDRRPAIVLTNMNPPTPMVVYFNRDWLKETVLGYTLENFLSEPVWEYFDMLAKDYDEQTT
jgi:hypothetical protein